MSISNEKFQSKLSHLLTLHEELQVTSQERIDGFASSPDKEKAIEESKKLCVSALAKAVDAITNVNAEFEEILKSQESELLKAERGIGEIHEGLDIYYGRRESSSYMDKLRSYPLERSVKLDEDHLQPIQLKQGQYSKLDLTILDNVGNPINPCTLSTLSSYIQATTKPTTPTVAEGNADCGTDYMDTAVDTDDDW